MALVILAGVAVLIHWIRDAKRRITNCSAAEIQASENYEPKRLIIVGSRKSAERPSPLQPGLPRLANAAMRARSSGPCCHECERGVYEAIVRSGSIGRK